MHCTGVEAGTKGSGSPLWALHSKKRRLYSYVVSHHYGFLGKGRVELSIVGFVDDISAGIYTRGSIYYAKKVLAIRN
jgi:hypothetical protein